MNSIETGSSCASSSEAVVCSKNKWLGFGKDKNHARNHDSPEHCFEHLAGPCFQNSERKEKKKVPAVYYMLKDKTLGIVAAYHILYL